MQALHAIAGPHVHGPHIMHGGSNHPTTKTTRLLLLFPQPTQPGHRLGGVVGRALAKQPAHT
jgi:hypothetical protein